MSVCCLPDYCWVILRGKKFWTLGAPRTAVTIAVRGQYSCQLCIFLLVVVMLSFVCLIDLFFWFFLKYNLFAQINSFHECVILSKAVLNLILSAVTVSFSTSTWLVYSLGILCMLWHKKLELFDNVEKSHKICGSKAVENHLQTVAFIVLTSEVDFASADLNVCVISWCLPRSHKNNLENTYCRENQRKVVTE